MLNRLGQVAMRADKEWPEGVKEISHPPRGDAVTHKARNTNVANRRLDFHVSKDKEFVYVCVIATTIYSSKS